ncbi:MAG: hypothetical protein A2358_01785 [Candidatus Staskawiczbacteria bacterium RIFOXYB1_FULL_37_44]|uniref:Uncharacterized protein n=1 Tax=Candidatus Staskawiczbacteria bacterium RIFOXYB1_FULL_37_44 TaxID=1802223 RepID=A0A1G2IVH9_9BACT|nr:MAG: hypothetical protein A2358_01785 [Candidatus Staskawiczbacteria bacterium RIFOXYB1_FULL_37_44]OGZ84570.1 MAG: hypothetical protein A2416_01630 [Candidatus Staskawiczbacteria bacterium RIFOXYC1_FULL_37_52]OGZ87479.1 MAG: hypothetical protein A2444_02055 [Candidatus Staskawiczbacteria bacterium RIFOXYC2_FULL_37_19]OGZ89844.1 MAG: hypothetical protein A2581_04000 [Candidatus Staskawiczbacteria bacterium RIFOXYD1_FULL_37_110]
MKKQIWLVIILAIIIVILTGVLLWPKPKNNNSKPVISDIQITSPKAGEEISSPKNHGFYKRRRVDSF